MNRLKFVLQLIDRVSGPAKAARRALAGVQRAMERVGRVGKRAGTAVKSIAERVGKLGTGAINMSGQLSLAASNMQMLAQQGVGVLKVPIGEFVDFEHAMSRVKALSNSTTAQFEEQTKVARHLGATTIFTAKEAADGMGYLAMAGFKAHQQIAALPAVLDLATAAGSDLGRTAEISSNIMGAFGIRAEEMRSAADILAATFTNSNTTLESLGDTMKYVGPAAKAAGVSLSSVAKFAALMGNAGIDGSMAGTAMRTMLLRLAAPPKKAAAALQSLGIKTQDAAGNLREPVEILRELNAAMKGLGTAQKAGKIEAIFGKYAISGVTEVMDKLAVGADAGVVSFQKMSDAIDKATGATKRIADIQSSDSWGEIKRVASAFSELMITVGKQLKPALMDATKAALQWIEQATAWVKQNPLLVTQIAKTVAVLSGLAAIGGVVASVGSAVMFGFGGLFKLLSGGFQVLRWTAKLFLWIGQGIGRLMTPISSIAGYVARVSGAFWELAQGIWAAGKAFMASPLGRLFGVVGSFVGGVQAGNWLDSWVPKQFGGANENISTHAGNMISDLVMGERQRASGRGVTGGRGFGAGGEIMNADNRTFQYQPVIHVNMTGDEKDGKAVGNGIERVLRRDSDRMQLQGAY